MLTDSVSVIKISLRNATMRRRGASIPRIFTRSAWRDLHDLPVSLHEASFAQTVEAAQTCNLDSSMLLALLLCKSAHPTSENSRLSLCGRVRRRSEEKCYMFITNRQRQPLVYSALHHPDCRNYVGSRLKDPNRDLEKCVCLALLVHPGIRVLHCPDLFVE